MTSSLTKMVESTTTENLGKEFFKNEKKTTATTTKLSFIRYHNNITIKFMYKNQDSQLIRVIQNDVTGGDEWGGGHSI